MSQVQSNNRNEPGVHVVGSVAMDDAGSVFRAVADPLGPWVTRIPDGETGERGRWIYWQREMLLQHPAMELDPDVEPLAIREWDGTLLRDTELLRFKPGVDHGVVSFNTGYDRAAIDSYRVFEQLGDEGVIGPDVRFQVSLPTPMASGLMYVSPNAIDDYLPIYERDLLAALGRIVEVVPAERLAIQWDVCQEVLLYEDYFPNRGDDYRQQVLDQLGRLGAAVPPGADLGYHLCYGSPRDVHLVMPSDTAILVELANGIAAAVPRSVEFIHMPVPQDRTDSAYFAPLTGLDVAAETEIYLGLIHHDDVDGDRARMDAAGKVLPRFGVSTECGWGRADPERVPALIESHRLAMIGRSKGSQ